MIPGSIGARYEGGETVAEIARSLGVAPLTVRGVLRATGQLLDNRPRCSRCGMLLAECGPARDEWGTPTDDPPHVDGVCWACRRELAFEQEHSVEIAALYEAMEVVA